jgi:tetrahydrodipicolinate N-succinyltransferase
LNNRRKNRKPTLPKVIGTKMDSESQMSVVFDQDIMLPDQIDQTYWDLLLEVKVISNSDDSVYTGLFHDLKRNLQNDYLDKAHFLAFKPTITKFNKTMISIKFNFSDPSKLALSNQANFRIRIKEPELLRT